MSATVAEILVETLYRVGVRQIFGVVGDALNPLTDAVRRDQRIEWIGVRHEEGAALAAAGQAKLSGRLAVCCGTTGPGANHLVAGLYEARKDHAPVLAISGGVPASRRGIDYLQENVPDLLFRDVAAYTQTIIDPTQAVQVVRQAIAQAYHQRGVAHISIPADVIGGKLPGAPAVAGINILRPQAQVAPPESEVTHAAQLIDAAASVAIFVGNGCRAAIDDVAALAARLQAPLVHTFRAKDMLPYDHPHWIGGVGLIGGAPGMDAMRDAELLLMLGTDYPYSEFLPTRPGPSRSTSAVSCSGAACRSTSASRVRSDRRSCNCSGRRKQRTILPSCARSANIANDGTTSWTSMPRRRNQPTKAQSSPNIWRAA